ncbi:MAG: helix-turn-helix transcriptional regulator [Patescibacteria group bacterium]|nr:helix-turn-helix transcriptional regulator [Patescibacteria group bacterium]
MSLNKIKEKLLQNKNFNQEFYSQGDLTAIVAEMVQEARLSHGLTQAELAKKINTKQSAISRLESGSYSPNLSFLKKIAQALGLKLLAPRFISSSNLVYAGGFSWQLGNSAWKTAKQTDIIINSKIK